jgi:hypothetical protein
MGRPGRVSVLLEHDEQSLQTIAIAGTARIVFATSVDFP